MFIQGVFRTYLFATILLNIQSQHIFFMSEYASGYILSIEYCKILKTNIKFNNSSHNSGSLSIKDAIEE